MIHPLLKLPYLRLKYRYFPSESQEFWAQELFEAPGLGGKLGQIFAQGQKTKLPKSSLSPGEALLIMKKNFSEASVTLSGEVFAASMGQVFTGTVDGRKIAVKILHPKIRAKIKNEIENILLLGGYFAKAKGFRFDRDVFRRFLTDVFEEETDLERERIHQESFGRIVQGDARFVVPGVIRELSNETILTQEFTPCTLARDLSEIPNHDVFHFFFHALFKHNTLHGDLNDRNWGLNQSGQTVIYDFGCAQTISERRVGGLRKLLRNENVTEGFSEFGIRLAATHFSGREQELRDKLFSPLLDRPITRDLHYSEELERGLGREIKQLREYTDPWVLLFMRSLFSMVRVYQERLVEIPLSRILQEHLSMSTASPGKSTALYVEVTEDKRVVISLKLPVQAIEAIEGSIPDHVLARIREEELDLSAIISSVKASNYSPQEILGLSSGNRFYRVWIE